jgi:hypothetical protein
LVRIYVEYVRWPVECAELCQHFSLILLNNKLAILSLLSPIVLVKTVLSEAQTSKDFPVYLESCQEYNRKKAAWEDPFVEPFTQERHILYCTHDLIDGSILHPGELQEVVAYGHTHTHEKHP